MTRQGEAAVLVADDNLDQTTMVSFLLGKAGYRVITAADGLEAFETARRRHPLLVEGDKDYAIIMLDPSGRVASWNEGAERIKGYSAEEIVGEHCSCFFPEEDVRQGVPELELAMAASEGRHEAEGWRVRKDGTRF